MWKPGPEFLPYLEKIAADPLLTSPLSNMPPSHFKNKLEAIALMVSHREEEAYKVFIERIEKSTNPGAAKDLDFYIFLNREVGSLDIRPLQKIFKNVHVKNLDIPPEDDLYVRPDEPLPGALPPLGAKSGPNSFFFSVMAELSDKQTSLILETDCYFGKNWLPKLRQQCERSNPFWICGATYSGPTRLPNYPGLLTHLNGVALYATGDRHFQTFLGCLKEFLIRFSSFMPRIAYDHGLRLFVDGNLRSKKAPSMWGFIDRQLKRTNLILNYSIAQDSVVDADLVLRKTSCAILHKKDPSQGTAGSSLEKPSRFPVAGSVGILDCYARGGNLFFDLDPRFWIEKSDQEIIRFFRRSVNRSLNLKGAVVKRTVQYHAAIFLRAETPPPNHDEPVLLGAERCFIKKADCAPSFLQVVSLVRSRSEAQMVIDHWGGELVAPDRFVFYCFNSSCSREVEELTSTSASITSHLWCLPRMHQVSNPRIFKSGQEYEFVCININSAYSHCLKYHHEAVWTLFVTPQDRLLPLNPSPNPLSLVSSLRELPAEISVLNLPLKTSENRTKPIYLPVFRTCRHVFTACLNWGYAQEEHQIVDPRFRVLRGAQDGEALQVALTPLTASRE